MAPTLRVVRAVYDYEAQEDDELSVVEGELLHVIGDADEPGWLVCARKVDGADDMVGNVPENYVEEPTPLYSTSVLYDYDALNEDELTVYESATIDVFEELPDDWVVARLGTAYGLVPANYIDRPGADTHDAAPAPPAPAPPAPVAASIPPPVVAPSPALVHTVTGPSTSGATPPKLAVAEYDYDPVEPDDVDVQEGENCLVLDDSDADWVKIRIISTRPGRANKEGFVPRNYLKFREIGVSPAAAAPAPPVAPAAAPGYEEEAAEEAEEDYQQQLRWQQDEAAELAREQAERARVAAEDAARRRREAEEAANERLRQREIAEKEARARELEREREREREMEEERRRAAAIAARPPALPSRPVTTTPPAIADRPPVLPTRPPVAIDRTGPPRSASPAVSSSGRATPVPLPRPALADTHRRTGSTTSSSSSAMPDPAYVRVWLDQSGVHRTEAAFIDFIDGKVKLHKTNGAKIDVPIAALSPADQAVAYKLKGLTPPAALVADVSGPATEPPLDAPTSYNGFDWYQFLVSGGVEPLDARTYAARLVGEKLDGNALGELNREILKGLGVKEGDILRIQKHIAASSQHAARESQLAEQNLAKIERYFAGRAQSSTGTSSSFTPRSPAPVVMEEDQVKADEELARRLQQEELARANMASGRPLVPSKPATPRSLTGSGSGSRSVGGSSSSSRPSVAPRPLMSGTQRSAPPAPSPSRPSARPTPTPARSTMIATPTATASLVVQPNRTLPAPLIPASGTGTGFVPTKVTGPSLQQLQQQQQMQQQQLAAQQLAAQQLAAQQLAAQQQQQQLAAQQLAAQKQQLAAQQRQQQLEAQQLAAQKAQLAAAAQQQQQQQMMMMMAAANRPVVQQQVLPQATGRTGANWQNATPDNPFGNALGRSATSTMSAGYGMVGGMQQATMMQQQPMVTGMQYGGMVGTGMAQAGMGTMGSMAGMQMQQQPQQQQARGYGMGAYGMRQF